MAPAPATPSPNRRGKRASISFGSFKATPETIWRPRMRKFEPHCEMTEGILDALRAIERSDHELALHPQTRGGIMQRIRRESLARNAFATASIEGNPLTLPEVESLLKQQVSPASSRDPYEIEILNYAEFMTGPHVFKAPRVPQDVLRVHAALFRDVLKDAGAWKSRPNFIGSSRDRKVVYVPSAPERVVPELTNALAWLHDVREVHPVVRALVFHHEFESIHPFRDGNGRTGRALTPMILREFGYSASVLAPIDYLIYKGRAGYYQSLAAVERNGFRDYTPWLGFMAGVLRDAYQEAVAHSLFQKALPSGLQDRQRSIAEWFAHLRQQDSEKRVKFNDVHHAFPEIPGRTLKRDLTLLRDQGVLDATGAYKGTAYRLRDRK